MQVQKGYQLKTPERTNALLLRESPDTYSREASRSGTPNQQTRIFPVTEQEMLPVDNSNDILGLELQSQNQPQRRRPTNDNNEEMKMDEYQEGFQRKKKEGLKTFIQNGVTSVLKAPGEAIKFIVSGGKQKNKLFIKQMSEKQQSSQAKLTDENFKKNHPLVYSFYFIGFYIQYIVMPFIILFGTVLSLISLFLWRCLEDGQLGRENLKILQNLEVVSGVSIGIEWLVNMYISPDNIIVSFFEAENLMDSLLVFQSFWRYFQGTWYKGFAFFNILKSLRILKLSFLVKVAIQNFKKFVLKIKQNDVNASDDVDYDDEGQLNRFIVDSLIKLFSGVLIESTYFLSFDQITDYEGFYPFTQENRMNYLSAIYYTIVTFSTIGYGDIYPIVWKTRLTAALAFLINITVMSNFLGKFIEFLFQLSPYDRDYDFGDHVVIIGKITDEVLKDFIDELVENDKVQNKLLFHNEFKTGIKVIIVREDEPNDTLRQMALYYAEQYGNEVCFLKEGIFTAGKKWYHQANLKEARIVFAFSWFDEKGNGYENDKLISLSVTGVRDTYPDLRIMLVLNTSFKEQLEKDSLYKGIQSISPFQLNQYIMASSLENPGFCTILQHLLTMKAKNISNDLLAASKHDPFMLSYIADMQQEIYSLTIPDFFVGMTFKECALMLYMYGLEFSMNEVMQGKFIQDHIRDDRKMTLLAVESSYTKSLSEDLDHLFDGGQGSAWRQLDEEHNALIFQQKFKENLNFTSRENLGATNQQKSNIMINPQNYTLRKGDIIYVICDDYEIAMEALEIDSKESSKYIQYATNMISMQKNMETKFRKKEMVYDMYKNMFSRYNDFEQELFDEWKKKKDTKCQSLINISDTELFPEENQILYAFDFIEQIYPGGTFQDHYVVFGNLDGFTNVIQILRKYTRRPAILFSESKLDPNKWENLIESYENLLFIRGKFLNLDDLARLNLKQAYQILIMSNLIPGRFPDAVGICLSRILLDQYDRNSFMIQLDDESKISFLNKNPRLKEIECPNFFYPSFAAGTVHFSSMTTAILARIVYSPNWLRFFEDLTITKKSGGSVKENKVVRCLRVTNEVAKNYSFFGQLQFSLMEQKPSIIGIAMVKHTFGSRFHENLIETFLTDEFIQELNQIFQDIDLMERDNNFENQSGQHIYDKQRSSRELRREVQAILQKILGDRFILTNPSFYTVIEENDEILVLGDLESSETTASSEKTKLSSPDPFDADIEKLLKDMTSATAESPSRPLGRVFKMTPDMRDATTKYLTKLRDIKSFKKSDLRIRLKLGLLEELKKKYQSSVSFYEDYHHLII